MHTFSQVFAFIKWLTNLKREKKILSFVVSSHLRVLKVDFNLSQYSTSIHDYQKILEVNTFVQFFDGLSNLHKSSGSNIF